jgi:hypothetical protein
MISIGWVGSHALAGTIGNANMLLAKAATHEVRILKADDMKPPLVFLNAAELAAD